MISFGFDGTAIAAVVLFALYVFSVILVALVKQDNENYARIKGLTSSGFTLRSFIVRSLLVLGVSYAIFGLGTVGLVSSQASQPNTNATTVDLARHFGLESGSDYPLVLSDPNNGGSIGHASTSSGLFGSSSAVSLRPTSTVSVGFQKNDSWWQLTLPTDTIE